MSNRFTHTLEDRLFIWSRVTQEWRMVLTLVRVTGLASSGSLCCMQVRWYWSFMLWRHLTQTWRQTNTNVGGKKISFVPSPLSDQTHGNLLPNLDWWPVDAKGASISRALCLGTAGRTGAVRIFCLRCVVPAGAALLAFWRHPSLFAGWARLGLRLPLAAAQDGPGSFSATVSLCPTGNSSAVQL